MPPGREWRGLCVRFNSVPGFVEMARASWCVCNYIYACVYACVIIQVARRTRSLYNGSFIVVDLTNLQSWRLSTVCLVNEFVCVCVCVLGTAVRCVKVQQGLGTVLRAFGTACVRVRACVRARVRMEREVGHGPDVT